MDRGLKILMDTYWSAKGWKTEWVVSEEDFAIARQEGYMFDRPPDNSHEQAMEQLAALLTKISAKDVADAFLYSLSARQLAYRSALGSYWYAAAVPEHEALGDYCKICGFAPNQMKLRSIYFSDINCCQFERYKWGGTRHDNLSYALFDLSQFLLLPKVKGTREDMALLRSILDCVNQLEAHNKAAKLRDCVIKQRIIKTNTAEISVLLNILGICGVLASSEYPAYVERFACRAWERDPPELTNDFSYPLNHWHVSDGINAKRFQIVFGEEY